MSDDFRIPVTTHLPRSVYARIYRAAEANNTTAGELVAELVRRALEGNAKPAPRKRTRAPRMRPAPELLARIKELHERQWSDSRIAKHLELSQPSVSRWRREDLGLPALTRSPNQRQRGGE